MDDVCATGSKKDGAKICEKKCGGGVVWRVGGALV